eukprot:SAG31_NODE_29633_length_392_cov_0.843003_1_plen_90_part_10
MIKLLVLNLIEGERVATVVNTVTGTCTDEYRCAAADSHRRSSGPRPAMLRRGGGSLIQQRELGPHQPLLLLRRGGGAAMRKRRGAPDEGR